MNLPKNKKFKILELDRKTLGWWRSRRSKIDMDPPYQRRGRLWSDADKAYLIDSILNGFDVPKIYMADFTWGDSKLNLKKLPYAIIDGKQRFEAIFDFFDGKIVLNEDFVYLPNPELKLSGLGYQDLQKNYPEVADEFDTYNLLVMSVFAEAEDFINELFVRLNRSKPLTGAEIRNAMSGLAPSVIRQIAKHEFFHEYVRFQTQRGQDLNAAAKILLFEYHGKPRETKKRNLDEFVRETRSKRGGRLEVAGRRVVDLLDELTEIFLPCDGLLASAGIIPVYYWFVRSGNEENYHYIREFLVNFEVARRKNKELIAEDPKSQQIDQELTRFDGFNRSTNDEGSHVGRLKILNERFEKFLNTSTQRVLRFKRT